MNTSNTNHIKSKENFLDYLRLTIQDFDTNGEHWVNNDLISFLQGMQSWLEDMDGYYTNVGEAIPANINWKFFADVIAASKMYE